MAGAGLCLLVAVVGLYRHHHNQKVNKMLNGKEIKSVKDMDLTGTPEWPVYSGGTVTFHTPVADVGALKENHPELSWGNVGKPVFDTDK